MTDTAMVPRKNGDPPDGPAPLVDEQLADELLGRAQAEGVELLGPDGLHQGRAVDGKLLFDKGAVYKIKQVESVPALQHASELVGERFLKGNRTDWHRALGGVGVLVNEVFV